MLIKKKTGGKNRVARSSKASSRRKGYTIADLREVIRQQDAARANGNNNNELSDWNKCFQKCLELAKLKNRVPTEREFKKMKVCESDMKIFIFQLLAMGFRRKIIHYNISNQELLEELYQIYKKIKKLPRQKHVIEFTKYSMSSYHRRFGTITHAVKLMQMLPHFVKTTP